MTFKQILFGDIIKIFTFCPRHCASYAQVMCRCCPIDAEGCSRDAQGCSRYAQGVLRDLRRWCSGQPEHTLRIPCAYPVHTLCTPCADLAYL